MPVGPSYVEWSSLCWSTSVGSVATPMTGTGRVWATWPAKAPSRTTTSTSTSVSTG